MSEINLDDWEPDPKKLAEYLRNKIFDDKLNLLYEVHKRKLNGDAGSSWAPIDLTDALNDESDDPPPAYLVRTDGRCLLYKGCTHSIHGPTGSGKSWLAQYACAQRLKDGGCVLYIDYESDEKRVTRRLRMLGVSPQTLKDNFTYIRPENRPDVLDIDKVAFASLLSNQYDIVIVDGANISMSLCGLSSNSAEDVATWHKMIMLPMAEKTGAAVVAVDHVTKSNDRNGYAIGSQHKIAGLTGAGYTVEMIESFGRGLSGKATIRVGDKDRDGYVRGYGLAGSDNADGILVGEFCLDATKFAVVESGLAIIARAELRPPDSETVDKSEAKNNNNGRRNNKDAMPRAEMEMVSAYCEENATRPDMRSGRQIVENLRARAKAKNESVPAKNRLEEAIRILKDTTIEGGPYMEASGNQSRINTNLKRYYAKDDPLNVDISAWKATPEEGENVS